MVLEDGVCTVRLHDHAYLWLGQLLGRSLSRWVSIPAVVVRTFLVFVSSTPEDTIPSKDAIREVQQQARFGRRG